MNPDILLEISRIFVLIFLRISQQVSLAAIYALFKVWAVRIVRRPFMPNYKWSETLEIQLRKAGEGAKKGREYRKRKEEKDSKFQMSIVLIAPKEFSTGLKLKH